MKSLPGRMGNVHMRGKKTKQLRCGCCVCRDLREKENARLAKSEIRLARAGIAASMPTTTHGQDLRRTGES